MQTIEFPFILSGPVLRRIEPKQVYIWIATSRSCKIKTKIYKILGNSEFTYDKLESQSETKSLRLGKKLFIHLIKVTPIDDYLPIDTLLGYNLILDTSSESHDLRDFNLGYGDLKFPTFQIKSGNTDSHILYGSCRKLHGEGHDTLAIGDSILEKECFNLSNRPDSLFLMGDQIYADDVADPIFRHITFLSKELMGKDEPLDMLDYHLKKVTSLKLVNGRQYIMEHFCQFTSTEAQNHLIELGEFAAMYLLSWAPQLWEGAQIETFQNAESNQHIHFAFPHKAKEHETERSQLEKRYKRHQEALLSFQQTLPKVRRLLANIPTYMIFDDHDITDDWNLSSNWRNNVESSPLGRHVVANGLTAYWAFQGWGNDPESFDDDFIQTIESYFKRLGTWSMDSTYEKWVNLMWRFDSWHYVTPTWPKAVFLDSRTQRDYDSRPNPVKFGKIFGEENGCPQLLSKAGWKLVSEKLRESNWRTNSSLIIVAATPVYGMGLIESFLHDYVYPLKVLGVDVQTSFDFEAWKYNGEGFTEFLLQAAEWSPNPCIILSGDVHYASAVKSKVTFQDGRELVMNQFTSSPFKNMSFSGLWGLLMRGVIGLNVRSRKNKDIYRYCTPNYEIVRVDDKSKIPDYLWKDQLRYQFLEKESIIETNNNIGLLSITGVKIKNTLFT